MTSRARFTLEEVSAPGKRIGVDWVLPLRPRAVLAGMDVEREHRARDPVTNVTDDDVIMAAKIARAHLNEFPDG